MSSLFRKHLGIPNLIKVVYQHFSEVSDPREFSRRGVTCLSDHLMSGLAVFGLKCPSLLDYDRKRKNEATEHNLRDLYHVQNPPSDTYLRERLDEVNPKTLRPAFKKLFAHFQRGNGVEAFEYLDGYVLISIDGTGHFSSNSISCPHCCEKTSKDGQSTYYHQMLGACLVHPDKKGVVPFCPEVIMNEDGATKNDCERNASKRFLEHFRREHPHLKAIILEDGLSANAPNIETIQKHDLRYILGAKPGDHKFLFEQLHERAEYHEMTLEDGSYHQFHFLNGVPLNKSHKDLRVNVLEYRYTDPKGKESTFSWVTDITLSKNNVMAISKAGRARWRIENETFNTLKNLGYNFEHNYGHGKRYLSTVLCMLMMLSFLIDQIQEICCCLFRRCKEKAGTYRGLWEAMRSLFRFVRLYDWETFYLVMAEEKTLNTS
jgi:hypothetical protein